MDDIDPILEAYRDQAEAYNEMLELRAKFRSDTKKVKLAQAKWRGSVARVRTLCERVDPDRPAAVLRKVLNAAADAAILERKRKR